MSLDPALVAETRAWLAKASTDLAAGGNQLEASPPLYEVTVFHAQQAVEKALKSFLTWHGHAFRKTHNLVELGEACAKIAPELEPLLRRAAPLTEYAWRFRYPGEPEVPAEDEARDALATAREVFEAVAARLPAETRP